jgi:hypothetical protein
MLVGVWNGAAGPTRPIQVVALASRSEFSAFADHSLVGVHVRRPPFPPMLVITGAFTSGKDTAKHELAHDLSFHMLPIEPRWYAEGIATYLETTRYDREQGRAILGEIAEDRYRFLQVGGGLMSSEDLWKPVPDDLMDVSRFYATSWLLVHYLMNHRPEQFARFQHRLGALEPGPQAFRAEFPDLDPDKLTRTLSKYARTGDYTVISRVSAGWTGTPQTRVLSDAEVHGVRALLYGTASDLRNPDKLAAARAEVDEALRAPTPSVDALAVARYVAELGYHLPPAELAARAVHADRGRWMAWLMMADAATSPDAASLGALIQAYELDPGNPEIVARLSLRKANEGKWAQALGFTNHVLAAGVQHHEIWFVHLRALIETGRCEEATRWRTALEGYLPPNGRDARALAAAAARPCVAT